jgi:hypothetical protein
MKRKQKRPEILNRGSLMTYRDNGTERCFGYLLEFAGHGIYEPTFGKLDVTSEEAKTHNELLSQAEINGLDNNCEVGMGGMFYTRKAGPHDRRDLAGNRGESGGSHQGQPPDVSTQRHAVPGPVTQRCGLLLVPAHRREMPADTSGCLNDPQRAS